MTKGFFPSLDDLWGSGYCDGSLGFSSTRLRLNLLHLFYASAPLQPIGRLCRRPTTDAGSLRAYVPGRLWRASNSPLATSIP